MIRLWMAASAGNMMSAVILTCGASLAAYGAQAVWGSLRTEARTEEQRDNPKPLENGKAKR